ncbi:MAG: hypothetical protein GF372_05455 [Candidatus Marinimicrobia bacterium]|nr:hypothetical protein [Candidatus Neomarinimicrobiota bacterium]
MKNLNRWMLYISLFTIIVATTIAILAIWQVVIDTEFVWKSLMTLGVIFLASLLTYTVNNLIPAETEGSDDQREN